MKTRVYFSISFLVILYFFNLGIYINYTTEHLSRPKSDSQEGGVTAQNFINWQKAYPIAKKRSNFPEIPQKRIQVIHKIISNIDSCSKGYLPYKMKFIEFGYFINKIIGGNLFLKLDSLIRFPNGYFGYITKDKDSFAEDGKRTVDLAKYLEKKNIKFGYILCPSKFSKFKNELPQGMIDYSNDNADSFLDVLQKNNIPVLDLRENLKKDYPNHFDAFFKTDHHWKPETGFWASQIIIEFLNKQLKLNLDENIIKKENFSFKIYPELFLGSQGKKVTLSFADPEDFTLITPNFDTLFKYEVYCSDIKKQGPFLYSLIEKSNLQKNYYKNNTYATYLGIYKPVARISNLTSKTKFKILIINDSFIHVIAPFIGCVCSEIVSVELRKSQTHLHFNGDIKKLIEKENPDLVLKLFHCGVFNPNSEDRFYIH